jgi:proteic killer suppression protein
MILSYRDKRTRDFASGKRVRDFESFRRQAEKRLDILGSATSLTDLRALPSNALESLKGERNGQYSIRINIRWRICFEWPDSQRDPSNVEIVDYH